MWVRVSDGSWMWIVCWCVMTPPKPLPFLIPEEGSLDGRIRVAEPLVCLCVCVYGCVCAHVYACVYACAFVYACACLCVSVYACMYVFVCICVCTRVDQRLALVITPWALFTFNLETGSLTSLEFIN